MTQPISRSANILLAGFDATHIDGTNRCLTGLKSLINALGYSADFGRITKPTLINKGVDKSASGIIQDPAGSAVGSGRFPSGSGGSGAIYAKFRDLDPVQAMLEKEAVFNSSTDEGARVMHSYSPHLMGTAFDVSNCQQALQDLANAYLNAFRAKKMTWGNPPTEEGFSSFNAVPLSGKIFAQQFKNIALDHLHPSYTLTSILIAQMEMLRAGETCPTIQVYYFDHAVYTVAVKTLGEY